MSTPRSKRLKGIKGDGFEISLEYGLDNKLIMVHLQSIDRLTKDKYIEMKILLEDWSEFFETMDIPDLYAGIDKDNLSVKRLAVSLGFRYLSDSDGISVYKYIRGED